MPKSRRKRASKTPANRKQIHKRLPHFSVDNIFKASRPESINGGKGLQLTVAQAIEDALPDIATVFDQPPVR